MDFHGACIVSAVVADENLYIGAGRYGPPGWFVFLMDGCNPQVRDPE
jgi:hypothetical protein